MLSDRMMALLRNPETPTYALRDAIAEEEPEVKSVWVVVGWTGEYSNEMTWTVAAYLEKADADALKNRLSQWCIDNQCGVDTYRYGRNNRPTTRPEEDPRFRCDYTGTWYEVEEIPLRVGVE